MLVCIFDSSQLEDSFVGGLLYSSSQSYSLVLLINFQLSNNCPQLSLSPSRPSVKLRITIQFHCPPIYHFPFNFKSLNYQRGWGFPLLLHHTILHPDRTLSLVPLVPGAACTLSTSRDALLILWNTQGSTPQTTSYNCFLSLIYGIIYARRLETPILRNCDVNRSRI